MEISKRDWQIFKEKLPLWQEAYMEKLIESYIQYLNSDNFASTKFWEIDKRIKSDKKKAGVLLELRKQNVMLDLVRLLNEGAITVDDLDDFSDELKESVMYVNDLNNRLE